MNSNVVPLQAGGKVGAIVPTTIEEVFRLATAIAKSGLAPNGMKTAEQLTVAIMHGMEIGLPPMMAVQKIAVINGRPTIWGDAVPALLWSRGFKLREWMEDATAHCEVLRPDGITVTRKFGKADAEKAGLWGKAGPWKQYPERMLQMRARAFAARDGAADALSGLYFSEELEEVAMKDVTPEAEQPARITAAQAKRENKWEDWQEKVSAADTHHDLSVIESEWETAGMPEKWDDPFMDLIVAQRDVIDAREAALHQEAGE